MALAVVPLLELGSLYKSKNNPTAAAGNLSPSLFLKRSKKKKDQLLIFIILRILYSPLTPHPAPVLIAALLGMGPTSVNYFYFQHKSANRA